MEGWEERMVGMEHVGIRWGRAGWPDGRMTEWEN